MELGSKKYIILMVLICIVFVIFIVKAFDYLPDKSVENNPMINNQNSFYNQDYNNQNNNQNLAQNQEESYDAERHKSGHIDFMPNAQNEQISKKEYEEIKAPQGVYEEEINISNSQKTSSLSTDEQAIKLLLNASKYKANSDYSNALSELQKIPELTNDSEINALSYEKTAEIYALQKRYGTALSFAGKAYGAKPSAYREMLIARIYYQSGDTENAVSRMSTILSRGFKD